MIPNSLSSLEVILGPVILCDFVLNLIWNVILKHKLQEGFESSSFLFSFNFSSYIVEELVGKMVTPNMKTSCLNYLLISIISDPDHNLSISLVLRCTKMTLIIKTYPLIQ